MRLFDFISRNSKGSDTAAVVIGYLRTETSKHLGHAVDSKEYELACQSAAERVESVLLPTLDKDTQQEVVDTLSSACSTRFNEAFGEYLILLWVRYCIIQSAVAEGKVKAEEATVPSLSQALHRQIKRRVAASTQ